MSGDKKFARPLVFVSRCLGFEKCRYDGSVIPDRFVEQLSPFCDLVTFCPEKAAGMGVPRKPVRLVDDGGGIRVFQPATGRDWTDALGQVTADFLHGNTGFCGAVFKHRSPSCGLQGVKIFQDYEWKKMPRKGSGVFAARFQDLFADTVCEDEGRLRNFTIRESFLTAVFTVADFDCNVQPAGIKELVAFQARNKYLFLGYNEKLMREMGRITANREQRSYPESAKLYRAKLVELLQTPPDTGRWVNVLQHAFGGVSDRLDRDERELFSESIEEYRDERIPLSAVTRLLVAWGRRFKSEYLLQQTFLRPYPEQLVEISDSGKGRNS